MMKAQWPTAQARDGMPPHSPEYVAKHKANGHGMANLNDYMAFSATWPSPQAMDGNKGSLGPRPHDTGVSLPQRMAAALRQWPTPTVADVQGGRKHRSGARSDEPLLNGLLTQAGSAFAGTPPAEIATDAIVSVTASVLPTDGSGQTTTAGWSTPSARCGKGSRTPNGSKHVRPGGQMLNGQIVETADAMDHSGPMPNGSSATTAKRGAPNPVFACWLMGFPDAWISGA
ncbi:MAG: hypothetical protein ACK5PJ_06435, partial [Ralstonia sp.]